LPPDAFPGLQICQTCDRGSAPDPAGELKRSPDSLKPQYRGLATSKGKRKVGEGRGEEGEVRKGRGEEGRGRKEGKWR